MGRAVGNAKLSIADELFAHSKQFSFEMASYILSSRSRMSFGKEMDVAIAPFTTKSLNSFHLRATEIDSIAQVNGKPVVYIERLSLAGLNAPLPTPYAEMIFYRRLAQDFAVGEFVNTLNMRLLGVSYQISRRRYLSLQDHKTNCPFVNTLGAFFGSESAEIQRKFSRLSFVFWNKERSADGLRVIIEAVLGVDAKVHQFQVRNVQRKHVVGLGKMRLGRNSELGRYACMCDRGVKIEITHPQYKRIEDLIFDRRYTDELRMLIDQYLGRLISYEIFAIPQNVHRQTLGTRLMLGKNTWMQQGPFMACKLL